VVFTVASLAPGASANFTGSYQVPLNCCVSSSTVRATGRDICTGVLVADTFTSTCTVITAPRIVVTKTCPPTALRPGELLEYSGFVSNAGNITRTLAAKKASVRSLERTPRRVIATRFQR
jgi:hypothetical protein